MDDHRRGDTLEQGVGPLGGGKPLGGGAELAALALDFDRTWRWTATLLGALLTVTVLFARATHAGS